MIKHGIDQEALIKQFSEASAKQGAAVRKEVTEMTLKALQGRELTLANIKQVLGTVAKAASTGAANNPLAPANAETLLASATAGMDAALATAVQANRKALQQMIDQGASLRETQAKKALADIEKMEDTFFAALHKAAEGSQASLEGPWAEVLRATQGKGTNTGAQATATLSHLLDSVLESAALARPGVDAEDHSASLRKTARQVEQLTRLIALVAPHQRGSAANISA